MQINATNTLKKLHKAERSSEFIESCIAQKVIPTFARLGTSTKNKLGKCQISPGKIEHMERNCLFSELKIQQEKVEKFQSHLQYIYELLKLSCETKLIFENKNGIS